MDAGSNVFSFGVEVSSRAGENTLLDLSSFGLATLSGCLSPTLALPFSTLAFLDSTALKAERDHVATLFKSHAF